MAEGTRMEALAVLLMAASVGAIGVVGLAQLLRRLPCAAHLRTGPLLAVSHTLIVCGWLALAPVYLMAERGADSPYGDVFVPYLLAPGGHICQPANLWFGQVAFPWLLGHMESLPASVLCVVVGPGLVGLVVGGVQWYVIGAVWERLAGRRVDAATRAAMVRPRREDVWRGSAERSRSP